MRSALRFVVRIALLACGIAACGGSGGNGTTSGDTCAQGLCGNGGGGSGPGSTSSSSGGGCTESWTCTPWAKGGDGMYTRTCTDANACGTTTAKPPEGPIALPELDLDFYKCKVEPIVDRGCSMIGCHGTETGRAYKVYARGRLRHKETVQQVASCPVGPQQIDLQDEGTGTVMCIGWSPHTQAEWQENYDNARSFMVGISDPEQSDLLAQPVVGGKSHAGVHLFSKADADYQTIKSWLGGAKLGSACNPAPN